MIKRNEYSHHIPERTMDALERYITQGIRPGDFLMSVLQNDLMESFGHADNENTAALKWLVRYIYNEVPPICHGSKDKVENWLAPKPIDVVETEINP